MLHLVFERAVAKRRFYVEEFPGQLGALHVAAHHPDKSARERTQAQRMSDGRQGMAAALGTVEHHRRGTGCFSIPDSTVYATTVFGDAVRQAVGAGRCVGYTIDLAPPLHHGLDRQGHAAPAANLAAPPLDERGPPAAATHDAASAGVRGGVSAAG